jgi:hypothetical protein
MPYLLVRPAKRHQLKPEPEAFQGLAESNRPNWQKISSDWMLPRVRLDASALVLPPSISSKSTTSFKIALQQEATNGPIKRLVLGVIDQGALRATCAGTEPVVSAIQRVSLAGVDQHVPLAENGCFPPLTTLPTPTHPFWRKILEPFNKFTKTSVGSVGSVVFGQNPRG